VDFFSNRLAPLVGRYQLRSQSVVEIEPDGSPEPDVAVLASRAILIERVIRTEALPHL
jgi:hypothetical protein